MAARNEMKWREIHDYFTAMVESGENCDIGARTYNVFRTFDYDDFMGTSEMVSKCGATASFAFLGRDANEHADVMRDLDSAGHEVVVHGHRHINFSNLSFEVAHDHLKKGLAAIEDAVGICPRGFFAPFGDVSPDTLRAADDLGYDWVLGNTDVAVPSDLTLVNLVKPFDTLLMASGLSPDATFDELHSKVDGKNAFLFHPNLAEYYNATKHLEDWIDAVQPVTISESANNQRVGIILDALRPLKVS